MTTTTITTARMKRKRLGSTLGFDGNEIPKRPSTTMLTLKATTTTTKKKSVIIPAESFVFEYHHQPTNTTIDLQLKGFPSESEQIWNSTGLTLWPCSHFLCEHLCEHIHNLLPPSLPGERTTRNRRDTVNIVELGSGLGRCGLLVHRLIQSYTDANHGASDNTRTYPATNHYHVYLTDGDTDTLYQLRQNVADNTQHTSSSNNDNVHNHISCHQLLWGEDSTRQFCARHNLLVKVNNQEESASTSSGIDLVIGSDLIYVDKIIEPLFDTVRVLLQQQQNGTDTEQGEQILQR